MTTFDDALAVMAAEFGTPTIKPRDPQQGRTHSEAWWYLPMVEGGHQPKVCLDDDDDTVGVAALSPNGSVKGWTIDGEGSDAEPIVPVARIGDVVRSWLVDKGGM